MSDPSVNSNPENNKTPRQKIKLPAPKHLGVDEHNRWRIPPDGLPLNDKDYDYLGEFPSQSRYFIHMFDARQTDIVNGKVKVTRHIPYTENPSDEDLIARSRAGLFARDNLRTIGLKHLRVAIAEKFDGLGEEYRLAQGEGRSPKSLLKDLFSSDVAKAACKENKIEFVVDMHTAIMETCDEMDWKLSAASKFMDTFNVAFSDGDPRALDNTKKRHCIINILAAQPVRVWQNAFQNACEECLHLILRKEKMGSHASSNN